MQNKPFSFPGLHREDLGSRLHERAISILISRIEYEDYFR